MHLGQFTVSDVLGCSAAILAFLPFLLAPGFCLGYFLDLFRFRLAGWPERALLSIALSFAVAPITATLLGRVMSLAIVGWLFVASAIAAIVIACLEVRKARRHPISRATKFGLYLALAWIVIAVGSVVDIQLGTRLYPSAASFDHSIRTAITAAAYRTGVPPANPLYFPGHFVTMRYYYYWYVICALPAKVFGLTPRITMLSSVVWAGFGVAALVPLYLKHFCGERTELRRKSIIGILLLAVTGLDLIPTLRIFLSEHTLLPDMEWWDWTQVTSWFDSFIWVPHHIAALVALLGGFLVLWVVPREASISDRVKAFLVAGLAFASAAGLSVYVTLTVGLALVIWTIVLLRSLLFKEFGMFVAAGVVAIAVSITYLHELRQPGLSGGAFAQFYVRALSSIQDWGEEVIPWEWLQKLFLAAMLPVYYTLELGFFALVGFVQAWKFKHRQTPLEKWEWASIVMIGASLLVGSFLMSTTGNNDLGYRALLLGQFVLLLWAVPIVFRWTAAGGAFRSRWTLLAVTFLVIGALGTVYQLIDLRIYTFLVDCTSYTDETPWLPSPDAIGWQLYYIRSGYQKLDARLPQDSIVQYNPVNPAYVPSVFYSMRQAVAGEGACGTAFGGDPFECMPYQSSIATLFVMHKSIDWQHADEVCRDLKIDVLVAQRTDRMWALRKSWIWTEKPIVANPVFRAFACGNRKEEVQRWFSNDR